MKKKRFSYYIRKKLNHRFLQGNFLDPKGFVSFLKEHEIRIDEKILERYESEGWLQPIFRITIPERLQKGGLILGNDGIKAFYKDGLIEFPKKGEYEPWSNFKHDYKKGELHDKKLMYYHPFQILQVKNIFDNKRFHFTYYDSYKKENLEKIMSNVKKTKKLNDRSFSSSQLGKVENIGFLMLLEEPYRFHSFGSVSLPTFRRGDSFESWRKWRRKFSAKKLLEESGFSVEQVRVLYDHFVTQAHFLDPLARWYDLTRIMRPSVIKKLKGDALTAQLYYSIIRMIAFFLYDLTGEKTEEPDTVFDGRKGEWKKNIYSDPFDYGTRKTQRGIIRFFVSDPTTRLYLLVEGETEERVIEKIFAKLSVSMTDDGISVINCRGIANIEENKVREIIQTANQDHIAMYIIADNENKSKRRVGKIQKQIQTDFNSHIWKKSFEEDNFGKRKVVALINSYLKKHGESLSDKEIRAQQKLGKALIKAIERAYGKKYTKGLFKTIQKKKPDISLELMKPRLKKIFRSKKVGKPSEIEKVLDEVFGMILNWG